MTAAPDPPPRPRLRLASRGAIKRLAVLFGLILLGLTWAWRAMVHMPGDSHAGPLPPITQSQLAASERLHGDVTQLAGSIGQRSTFHPRELAESALYIRQTLESLGYAVRDHSFGERGSPAPNMDVTLTGKSLASELIIVGAHYDSYQGTPGADDNASGVAATLELARRLKGKDHRYHTPEDSPETLDYHSMARVLDGVEAVVIDLANRP